MIGLRCGHSIEVVRDDISHGTCRTCNRLVEVGPPVEATKASTYGLLGRISALLDRARFSDDVERGAKVGELRVNELEFAKLRHELAESMRFLIGTGPETSGDG